METIFFETGIRLAQVNAVHFDGSDYIRRNTDMTGNADSKLIAGSQWFKRTTTGLEYLWASFTGSSYCLAIYFDASNLITVKGYNAAATEILSVQSSSAVTDTSWHHLAYSFNMGNAAQRHLILDGVDVLSVTTYTDDTLDLADATRDHRCGTNDSDIYPFTGDMAEFWLDYGTYIDLSSAAELQKFYLVSKPVNLGPDGSIPTGSAPLVYFTGDTATWPDNAGSGGTFTEIGTLTTASTSPSD